MLGVWKWGMLAAFVVLFVPMALAGWHLSRNKTLFFGGALFVTLAVGVHLTPYLPSMSDVVTSVSSFAVFDNRDSCLSALHEIVWEVKPSNKFDPLMNNSAHYYKSWNWRRSRSIDDCEFQKLGQFNALELLNGSWVLVAGDSQARIFTLSLLNLILDSKRLESIKEHLFKRHSDYQIVVDEIGMKLDFVWAPYMANLTDLVIGLKQNQSHPDVFVMDSGLWHMLHVTNASDYGVLLKFLRSAVSPLMPISPEFGTDRPATVSVSIRSPHLFWLGMPALINSMLNTAEKRKKMTEVVQVAYVKQLQMSELLRQHGSPLLLLDIESLSWNCGIQCTDDGMHYDNTVYEAAIQIMLNALLIESHQRL